MSEWKKDLFSDNSAWKLYSNARRVGNYSYNKIAAFSTFGIVSAFIIINEGGQRRIVEIPAIIENIRALSSDVLSFTTQLLGFLIAGFTIFSTVTNVNIFKKMANTKYKNTTALKFVFYCFMITFLNYVAFLGLCVVIRVFFLKNSPISAIISSMLSRFPDTKIIIVYIGLLIVSTWFVYLVLLLKSFIMNVYTSVLLVIAVGADD